AQVLVLTSHGGSSQIRSADEAGLLAIRSGSFIGLGQSTAKIAEALENELRVPVLDETGLNGYFDFSAYSSRQGREAALEWVHQLGLELIEANRPIELLVVRKSR